MGKEEGEERGGRGRAGRVSDRVGTELSRPPCLASVPSNSSRHPRFNSCLASTRHPPLN